MHVLLLAWHVQLKQTVYALGCGGHDALQSTSDRHDDVDLSNTCI